MSYVSHVLPYQKGRRGDTQSNNKRGSHHKRSQDDMGICLSLLETQRRETEPAAEVEIKIGPPPQAPNRV